jgi:hypothetical protein
METRKDPRKFTRAFGRLVREMMDIYIQTDTSNLESEENAGKYNQCCAIWARQALLCITSRKNCLILSSSVRMKTDWGLWFTETHKAEAVLYGCSRLIPCRWKQTIRHWNLIAVALFPFQNTAILTPYSPWIDMRQRHLQEAELGPVKVEQATAVVGLLSVYFENISRTVHYASAQMKIVYY